MTVAKTQAIEILVSVSSHFKRIVELYFSLQICVILDFQLLMPVTSDILFSSLPSKAMA